MLVSISLLASVTLASALATSIRGNRGRKNGNHSPNKKIKKEVPGRKKTKAKVPPTIRVITFHESFQFEAYIFEKHAGEDGYTHGFRQFIDGNTEFQCDELEQANFTHYFYRRVPNSNDKNMH